MLLKLGLFTSVKNYVALEIKSKLPTIIQQDERKDLLTIT